VALEARFGPGAGSVRAGAEQVEMPVISVNFVTWTLNGQRMSRSDHALLQVFVERAGEVVTKRELWNACWGSVPQNNYGRFTSRALEAAVSRLRRKGVPLVNIWGVGWLLPEDAVS
jgi:DNA-binding response OmpR family regulator